MGVDVYTLSCLAFQALSLHSALFVLLIIVMLTFWFDMMIKVMLDFIVFQIISKRLTKLETNVMLLAKLNSAFDTFSWRSYFYIKVSILFYIFSKQILTRNWLQFYLFWAFIFQWIEYFKSVFLNLFFISGTLPEKVFCVYKYTMHGKLKTMLYTFY